MTEKGSQGMERQAPVLRVYLLGTFQAERADGTALAMESVFGRSHSEILFKLLLCHPERRVIREYLVDVLWPGQVYNVMEGSLGVAKSILKTRLEALCGQPVMARLARQGRNSEALQHYTRLETALLEGNTEPGEETKALAHRLRSRGMTKPPIEPVREPKGGLQENHAQIRMLNSASSFWNIP